MLKINEIKCEENSKIFDKYFIKLVEEGLTPCFSISVLKNNEVIYDSAYGNSKPYKDGSMPITKETQFNIGSVTKPLTGALIVKLVEMGAITLNDPVKKYIDEFKFEDITIQNLLIHTAGYAAELYERILPPPCYLGKEDVPGFLRKIYEVDQLKHKPGEVFEYFTLGYCILMDIIERLTGKTLEEFARKYLFNPVGMSDTTYDAETLEDGKYVLPWDHERNVFFKEFALSAPLGDRGVYTTAHDLVKFGNVFLNKGKSGERRVFAEASIDYMLREIPSGKFMGYVWSMTPIFWIKSNTDIHGCFGDLNSPSAVGHTGFTGCMLLIDPEYKTTAAILTNSPKLHGDWKNYKKICNIIMSM